MKKNQVYLLFIVLFFAAVAAIIYQYGAKQKEKESTVYTLLPRKGTDTTHAEWRTMKGRADSFALNIKNNPTDFKSMLALAGLFVQEARISGNYAYYDMAAMKTVNDVLKVDSTNFEALVFKSLVYLSQHHFADGLATAEKAKKINPYNAYVYGLMIDGNVEMGMYDSAISNADKMVSIRPDLTSYSRISYIREIHGNYPGAIAAMKMAVEAGGPGDEYTEWSRTQLAILLEKTGDYKNAEDLYNISLNLRPNYPYALSGLGRVAMAARDYKKAIAYFQKADSFVTDNSIKEELADAYRIAGETKKADELDKAIIEELSANAKAGMDNEDIGHYADRELAYAYLKVNDNNNALEHALLEYNRRPDNIDVNETVAWVYYRKGEYAKALPYIRTALKTNSKSPVLLSRAALIFFKTGDKATAKAMLANSSANIAYLDTALRAEAINVIQQL